MSFVDSFRLISRVGFISPHRYKRKHFNRRPTACVPIDAIAGGLVVVLPCLGPCCRGWEQGGPIESWDRDPQL